jgi:TolB-like protein
VLPFEIHAQEDLTFIREGILDMLTSRLAHEEQVVPIPEDEVRAAIDARGLPETRKEAIALGEALGADFVVMGSLTVLGESISTDAKLIDVKQAKTPLNFNRLGASSGEVINHVDIFAAEIKEKVFHLLPAAAAAPSVAKPAPVSDARQHPEKLIEQATPEAQETKPPTPLAASPPAVGALTAKIEIGQRWLSQRFKTDIRDIAVGDVDGDGQSEIIVMERHIIQVYRFADDRLEKIGEHKEKSYNVFLNVGITDANANGIPEIYITNMPRQNYTTPISLALEWDGKRFQKIVQRQPWYLRVAYIPGRGKILFGQKRGLTGATQDEGQLFQKGIYELHWRDKKLVQGERHDLPKGFNFNDFTVGDIFNDGIQMTVVVDRTFNLRVYNANHSQEWTSDESYGSSNNYLEYRDEGGYNLDRQMEDMQRAYLPYPPLVVDMDGKGKMGFIAVRNNEKVKSLSRFKVFMNAHMEGMLWNGLNFETLWQTEEVVKLIGGFDVGDVDHDGRSDLVYAVVGDAGGVFGKKGRSSIVIQQLGKSE